MRVFRYEWQIRMKRIFLIVVLTMMFITSAFCQKTDGYGFEDGCLTVVDAGVGASICHYGDKARSVYISHITPFADSFFLGVGFGFHHLQEYQTTSLPLYLEARYYFVDKPFSPFVDLKAGTYFYLSTDRVNTDQEYSIAKGKKKEAKDCPLFFSPSIGAKWRIADSFGLQATLSDAEYMMCVYNENAKKYSNRFVGSLTFSLGIYFQIAGF